MGKVGGLEADSDAVEEGVTDDGAEGGAKA